MLNGKIKLADLKVKSFVTVLDNKQQTNTQGGIFNVKGKKSKTDRYSWNVTVVDVRNNGLEITGRRGVVSPF
jgi:uncharacterized protein (UPF0333 family)